MNYKKFLPTSAILYLELSIQQVLQMPGFTVWPEPLFTACRVNLPFAFSPFLTSNLLLQVNGLIHFNFLLLLISIPLMAHVMASGLRVCSCLPLYLFSLWMLVSFFLICGELLPCFCRKGQQELKTILSL